LILLISIIVAIAMLCIIFPLDSGKPGFFGVFLWPSSGLKLTGESKSNYSIRNILKIDDNGSVLTWSVDDKHLYYSKPAQEKGEEGLEELWASDIKGNIERIDTEVKLYNIENAKWSPDGTILSFVSNHNDIKYLFIFDTSSGIIKDITPKKIYDEGVISYNWDDESLNIIMVVDVVNPKIEIYNMRSQKVGKINIHLNACATAAFYGSKNIIFSDRDSEGFEILKSDISGDNISSIVEGREFVISPDRNKLVILSDGDSQRGLWLYNIEKNEKKELLSNPIYNLYWLSDGNNLICSTVDYLENGQEFPGNIYYMMKDTSIINITGAARTIFVPTQSGSTIAMSCPQSIDDNSKGVFIGEVFR